MEVNRQYETLYRESTAEVLRLTRENAAMRLALDRIADSLTGWQGSVMLAAPGGNVPLPSPVGREEVA